MTTNKFGSSTTLMFKSKSILLALISFATLTMITAGSLLRNVQMMEGMML